MLKLMFIPTALAATLAWQTPYTRPTLAFKEETITIEYTATSNEAVVVVAAETEQVVHNVRIKGPQGTAILELRSESGKPVALSGFVIEMRESTKETLFTDYSEGRYDLRGRATNGQAVVGGATLSHRLLRPPAVTYPKPGADDVPCDGLVVSWVPVQQARGYRIVIEQNDNDGIAVEVPGNTASFRVPDGLLLPGTDTQLEVGAVGANGNCTLVEVEFKTR